MTASSEGRLQVAQALLADGADKDAKNKVGGMIIGTDGVRGPWPDHTVPSIPCPLAHRNVFLVAY